jgi:hypothetical protein
MILNFFFIKNCCNFDVFLLFYFYKNKDLSIAFLVSKNVWLKQGRFPCNFFNGSHAAEGPKREGRLTMQLVRYIV